MNIDDLEPRIRKQAFSFPIDLSDFSIKELEARIEDLQAEIDRCRAEIASKQSSRADAESVFGSSCR